MNSTLAWSAAVAVAALATGAAVWTSRAPLPLVSVREVQASARGALREKLTGPEYFTITRPVPMDEEKQWIAPDDARAQVDRIVLSRHLGPRAAEWIHSLVTAASEPHPSRAIGGERISLPRLNLSLDALDPPRQHEDVSKVRQP